ncbi:hypothetical protein [Bradyrhizobium sp. 1(2017)]|uniref:hypothetical protein n=1 Tax=Bradyrhizobium sp. 1(2017) TaxID=1404888 RepID=UPI00140EECAF|nr:hypothetical protein [Bradyrhizobium sp. 1(2017)]QIO36958.1 hypothetical protein HAP40_36725 [Bradyrhizobium sp. 1(2017)]
MTATKLFKRAAPLLEMIEAAIPEAASNEYRFVSDEWFVDWLKTSDFSAEQFNYIITSELVEKAHLASLTAIIRAKRWADAVCVMYERKNFPGWAAAVRGLLESAGDTVDGLLQVPHTLALHHRLISLCLAGKQSELVLAGELEAALDHFVHAKWRRGGDPGVKAKDSVAYVRTLASVIPNVEALYHKLCGVCHPSSASIDYFNVPTDGGFKVSLDQDGSAIAKLCEEHPDALQDILMMHCNPPLMVLKVLHVFKVHPTIKALRPFALENIKSGNEIQRLLKQN